MVRDKQLQDLDLKTVEGYYNYITESMGNGQRSQVIKLFGQLSFEQKKVYLSKLAAEAYELREPLSYGTLQYCIKLIN